MLDDHIYFQDESVILYQGNNMDILPMLDPESVDVVVTSPPYNTQMVGNDKIKPSGFRKEHAMAKNLEKMTSGYSDAIPEQEYQDQQVAMLNMLERVLVPHGSVFYNTKLRWRDKVLIHPLRYVDRCNLNIRMEIVWNRLVGLTLNARRFFDSDERVYWLFKGVDWRWNQSAVGLGSVWTISPTPFKDHACVFPEALVARCLNGVARVGDLVLDPYAGSGTVAVVARKFGCKTILIEQDPKYCAVIVDRLRQGALLLDS